jgi:hypothetical protein
MNFCETFILIFVSFTLLLSYYTFLQTDDKYDSFLNHPFWFGIDENIVKLLVFFLILGVMGFVVSIGSWIYYPPKTGAVKDDKLFYALLLFFTSAILWPIATYYKKYLISVISLVLTAAASIWLLAGAIEEENSDFKFYRVAGLLFLCIVSVLGDGVIWNVNYIIKNKEKF